jgi:hypothetical protein
VLKAKTGSPIRKGKVGQGGRKVLSSSAALASVTGTGQKRRKPKVNDENKENSAVGTRATRATGVNGNTMTDGKKKKVLLGTNTERSRLPLKELAVNGFVDKGEGVSSVEVVVFFPG